MKLCLSFPHEQSEVTFCREFLELIVLFQETQIDLRFILALFVSHGIARHENAKNWNRKLENTLRKPETIENAASLD